MLYFFSLMVLLQILLGVLLWLFGQISARQCNWSKSATNHNMSNRKVTLYTLSRKRAPLFTSMTTHVTSFTSETCFHVTKTWTCFYSCSLRLDIPHVIISDFIQLCYLQRYKTDSLIGRCNYLDVLCFCYY